MSVFTILWIVIGIVSGSLEGFTIFKNRKGTLSETLRRNLKPVRLASAGAWVIFSIWFLWHIWFTGPAGTKPLLVPMNPPTTVVVQMR